MGRAKHDFEAQLIEFRKPVQRSELSDCILFDFVTCSLTLMRESILSQNSLYERSVWCVQVLSNGSLFVNKVFMEDAGKYGCMAGNNGGLEREEAYLHVHSGDYFTPAGSIKWFCRRLLSLPLKATTLFQVSYCHS